jgi:tetratricopeptide (TPR) repeat protein
MENDNLKKEENKQLKDLILKASSVREWLDGTKNKDANHWNTLCNFYNEIINLTSNKNVQKEYYLEQVYAYKKATDLDPEVARYWSGFGSAYLNLTKYLNDPNENLVALKESLKCFNNAVKLEPKNKMCIELRNNIMKSLGHPNNETNNVKVQNLVECYNVAKSCVNNPQEYLEWRDAYFKLIAISMTPTPQPILNLLPEKGIPCPNKINTALTLVRLIMYLNSIIQGENRESTKSITIPKALKLGATIIANKIVEMNESKKPIVSLKGIFGTDSKCPNLFKNNKNKYSLDEEKTLTEKFNNKIINTLAIPTFSRKEKLDNQTVCESELNDTVYELNEFIIEPEKIKDVGLRHSDFIGHKSLIENDRSKNDTDDNNSTSNMENLINYIDKKDVVANFTETISDAIGESNFFNIVDHTKSYSHTDAAYIYQAIKNEIINCDIGKMLVCQVPTESTTSITSSHFFCITKIERTVIAIWDPLTEEHAAETLYEPTQMIKNRLNNDGFFIKAYYGKQYFEDATACANHCIKYFNKKNGSQLSEKHDEDEPIELQILSQNKELQKQNNSINTLKVMKDLDKKHTRRLSVDENLKKNSSEGNKSVGTNRYYNDSSTIKTGKDIKTTEIRSGKGVSSERIIIAEKDGRTFSQTSKHFNNLKQFNKSADQSLKIKTPTKDKDKDNK